MSGKCEIPPAGWWCSREPGHDGPCAARSTGGTSAYDRVCAELRSERDLRYAALVERNVARRELAAKIQRIAELEANLAALAGGASCQADPCTVQLDYPDHVKHDHVWGRKRDGIRECMVAYCNEMQGSL